MTTAFDKPLSGFRYVSTRRGDTLQAIAARELRDATQWPVIASINGLQPPYITDDPTLVSATVVLSGSLLLVPAASAQVSAQTNPDLVFGIDARLDGGFLQTASGDLDVVSGIANLDQAIANRIGTAKGELLFHLDYGCDIWRLVGVITGPNQNLLASKYISDAMAQDSRISSVGSVSSTISGDAIAVTAVVQPVVGAPVTVNQVI